MSEITLYKINDLSKLKSKLEEKGFEKKNRTKKVEIGDGENKEEYLMEFYYNHNEDLNELSWRNFARSFGFNPSDVQSNPRAVILIEKGKNYYAASFGTAYHYVEPLSDKTWVFDFVKRVRYDKVNLMATTIPQSKLNKQISSYINYNDTEINVDEALNKITAYMKPNDDFCDVGEKIQAGNSLKFKLEKDNLETIAKTISYVENVIATEDIYIEIPYMVEIKDENRLKELKCKLKSDIDDLTQEKQLNNSIDVNNYITFSNEIINIDDFTNFQLRYKKKDSRDKIKIKKCDELTITNIIEFVKSNNIGTDEIFGIEVCMSNENQKLIKKLDKIIIYDCVDENCIFEYGKWTEYNQDYLAMVEKEVATIPAKFCPEYSFDSVDYDNYLTRKIDSDEKEDESFKDKEKMYNESIFNQYLRDCHDFEHYDKDLWKKKGYSVEIMDLYKDGVAYFVKKGSSSQKLSYVVDQSIEGIKTIRKEGNNFGHEIKTVCIWLILDRENDIHDENNNADINQLKAIILKNKLVKWKQQMRLWGYEPIIRINYKKRNDKKEG